MTNRSNWSVVGGHPSLSACSRRRQVGQVKLELHHSQGTTGSIPIVCTFKVKENSGLLISHSDDYPFIVYHGPHTYFQGEQRLSELNFQTLLLLFF